MNVWSLTSRNQINLKHYENQNPYSNRKNIQFCVHHFKFFRTFLFFNKQLYFRQTKQKYASRHDLLIFCIYCFLAKKKTKQIVKASFNHHHRIIIKISSTYINQNHEKFNQINSSSNRISF